MWASASGRHQVGRARPRRGHADARPGRWRRRTPGRRGRRPARAGPGCAGSRSPSAGRTPAGSRRPGCRRRRSAPAASSDVIRLCAPVICSVICPVPRSSIESDTATTRTNNEKPLGCWATRGDARAESGQPARPMRTEVRAHADTVRRRFVVSSAESSAVPGYGTPVPGCGDGDQPSRPCQVHTQALLPSASASTQNIGAWSSLTSRPAGVDGGLDPSAATSGGTRMSRWNRCWAARALRSTGTTGSAGRPPGRPGRRRAPCWARARARPPRTA